jgi:hypothetical protein
MNESMEQELARLRAENEKLKSDTKTRIKDITFKVSQKGALSVYGMGRFPVTLYREQWERLLGKKEELLQFIADNAQELKTKE